MTLDYGRDCDGAGPLFHYSANSPGLDVQVAADGTFQAKGTSSSASCGGNGSGGGGGTTVSPDMLLAITNFGYSATLSASGSTVSLSGDRIGRFEAYGDVYIPFVDESRSGVGNDGGWIAFPWEYGVRVRGAVNKLHLVADNVRTLTLTNTLVLVNRVSGDFGNFFLRWDRAAVDARVDAKVAVRFDLWVCQCSFTIAAAALAGASLNVDLLMLAFTPGSSDFWSIGGGSTYWPWRVIVAVQPQMFVTVPQLGLSLAGSVGATTTYWVLVDPGFSITPRLGCAITSIFTFGSSAMSFRLA